MTFAMQCLINRFC